MASNDQNIGPSIPKNVCKPPIASSSTKLKVAVMARPNSTTKAMSIARTQELATAGQRSVMTIRHRNNSANENQAKNGLEQFHARPVNRKLLASPTVGVSKIKPASPTRPVPFALHSDKRILQRKHSEATDGGIEKPADLTKCFKALPLPSKEGQQQRDAHQKEPFFMRAEKIGAELKEKRRKMAEKMEEERVRPKFHASLMPDFNRPVFCPILDKHSTEPAPFELSTDRRVGERKTYEEHMKVKEAEKTRVLQQRELERRRLEEEETRRMRAATVHQAQPVRKYVQNDDTSHY